MDFIESLTMAVKTITAHKLRSSLTMLGIVIGNSSVIGMVGIGQAAQRFAASQFEALGPNVLFVVPGSRETRRNAIETPNTLVMKDAQAINQQVPTIKAVSPQITSRQVVSYRQESQSTTIQGVTPEFLPVRNYSIGQGRFITEDDIQRNNRVAVLGAEVVETFFGQSPAIGQSIRIKNSSFRVVGILEPKGTMLGNNQDDEIYLPISTLSNNLVGRTSPYGMQLNFISVTAKNEDTIKAAQFQIENLLRLRHQITGEDDFRVETQKDILEIVGSITGALTLMLVAIATISLLVGGIGVMNIMLVSVTERTQEIGLRKALGARESDILIQFLIEAIILCTTGGLVGTGLGVGAILLIGAATPFATTISVPAIVVSVSISSAIGLTFGVIPARQAAKLDPIVALRSS
jgi:putative ABC transport system permease protein